MSGIAILRWSVGVPLSVLLAALWLAACAAPAPRVLATPNSQAASEPGEPSRDDFSIDVPSGWSPIPQGPGRSEDAVFEVHRGDYAAIVRVFVSGPAVQTIGEVVSFRRSQINENEGVSRITERRYFADEESLTPTAWLECESQRIQGRKWRSWSLIIPHDGRVWEVAGYAERDLYFVETQRLVSSFRFVQ